MSDRPRSQPAGSPVPSADPTPDTSPDATADPFGTAQIRDRVLRIWADAPERFREDANSEDDLVHGGYRERLVVELAQNAADAAAAAGCTGRLLLRLEADRLLAANTGAPLDAAGVLGLATLRASAKRDQDAATGRFGVGFAAVLAVTDSPALVSRSGAVRFSREESLPMVRALAARSPALAGELARRGDRVPALRLPFPGLRPGLAGGPGPRTAVPEGYDTVVLLPLRDARAGELASRLLEEVDDALLLALPALDEVVIEQPHRPVRRLAEVRRRWLVHSRHGVHRDTDLAHLPVEDRERSRLEVTWAVPVGATAFPEPAEVPDWAPVVHAPTPTEERLPWPVMLLAQLPLEPDRRTVHPGPVADAVIAAAAAAFAELAEQLVEQALAGQGPLGGRGVLDLLPAASAALPAGWFDASLREAVLTALRDARVLVGVDGRAAVRPRDALVLEGPGADQPALVAALGSRVANLVEVPARHGPLLRMLDVARIQPADLVERYGGPTEGDPDGGDRVPGIEQIDIEQLEDSTRSWREWLSSLAPAAADPGAREALATLAVPVLAEDGVLRTVRGARGTVLLEGLLDGVEGAGESDGGLDRDTPGVRVARVLTRCGVRIVDPRLAVDPVVASLLHRLGASRADPPALLAHPALVAAVRASTQEDPDWAADLAEAVLTLVGICLDLGHDVSGLTWLSQLAVPDTDGDLVPAGLLIQPGSPMARVVDAEAAGIAGRGLVERWSSEVLHAVGVAARPVLLRAEDVDLHELSEVGELPGGLGELDGLAEWAAELVDAAGRAADACDGREPLSVRVDGDLVAVRDLDLVDPGRLADLVDLLLADPASRRALVEEVGVVVEGTRRGAAAGWRGRFPGYPAWWLRCEIGGATAGPDTEAFLAGLLPPAPAWVDRLDPEAAAALGAVTTAAKLDADGWRAVLARLDTWAGSDASTPVPPVATLLRVWSGLGAADPARLPLGDDTAITGDSVWALDDTLRPVRSPDPVVVDGPHWLQRTDLAPFVVAAPGTAPRLAALLGLDLASHRCPGRVDTDGVTCDVPDALGTLWPGLPRRWREHEDLRVDAVAVDWWVELAGPQPDRGPSGESVVHAATSDGLARALAWAGGCWSARHALAAVLAGEPSAPVLLVDEAFG